MAALEKEPEVGKIVLGDDIHAFNQLMKSVYEVRLHSQLVSQRGQEHRQLGFNAEANAPLLLALQAEKKRSERANKRMAERTIDAQRVSATLPRFASGRLLDEMCGHSIIFRSGRWATARAVPRSCDLCRCAGTLCRSTSSCGSPDFSTDHRSGCCATSTCRTSRHDNSGAVGAASLSMCQPSYAREAAADCFNTRQRSFELQANVTKYLL